MQNFLLSNWVSLQILISWSKCFLAFPALTWSCARTKTRPALSHVVCCCIGSKEFAIISDTQLRALPIPVQFMQLHTTTLCVCERDANINAHGESHLDGEIAKARKTSRPLRATRARPSEMRACAVHSQQKVQQSAPFGKVVRVQSGEFRKPIITCNQHKIKLILLQKQMNLIRLIIFLLD